jgi:hypothetical protein
MVPVVTTVIKGLSTIQGKSDPHIPTLGTSHLIYGETARGTHWLGVCMGVRAVLDVGGEDKDVSSRRKSLLVNPAHSQSLR